MPMQRSLLQQKPPEYSVVTNKAENRETQTRNNKPQSACEQISGANIYLIESNNSCTIRLIQKAIDNTEISDSEFRQLVRVLAASQ